MRPPHLQPTQDEVEHVGGIVMEKKLLRMKRLPHPIVHIRSRVVCVAPASIVLVHPRVDVVLDNGRLRAEVEGLRQSLQLAVRLGDALVLPHVLDPGPHDKALEKAAGRRRIGPEGRSNTYVELRA